MKKLFCIVVVLCLCTSLAFGEGFDYSRMTDEQLLEVYHSVRLELLKRSLINAFDEKFNKYLKITSLSWERTINLEKSIEYTESGWSLPDGAELTRKQQEIHHYDSVLDHYENREVQRSRQVIDHYDTYYTYEDNGSGAFTEVSHQRPVFTTEYYTETVQEPVYRQVPKYATKYYYSIWRWMPSRDVTASGSDHNVSWPSFSLNENEREGQRKEKYRFTAENMNKPGEVITFSMAEIDWMFLSTGDQIIVTSDRDGAGTFIIDEQGNKIAELICEK